MESALSLRHSAVILPQQKWGGFPFSKAIIIYDKPKHHIEKEIKDRK